MVDVEDDGTVARSVMLVATLITVPAVEGFAAKLVPVVVWDDGDDASEDDEDEDEEDDEDIGEEREGNCKEDIFGSGGAGELRLVVVPSFCCGYNKWRQIYSFSLALSFYSLHSLLGFFPLSVYIYIYI